MRLIVLLILVALSGCTTINKNSFQSLSSGYREVVEQYSNENILINIVRASKNMPMSFLDIPSVIGTGAVTADISASGSYASANPASIPGFFSSGAASTFTSGLGLSVNNGFTFTQASLDNAEFMGAFLKDISLDTVVFRGTESQLPKAVLYSLLIDSIEVRAQNNNQVKQFINNPLDPEYDQFQRLLYLMIDLGLSVEKTEVVTPVGPPVSSQELTASFGMWSSTFAYDKDHQLSLKKLDRKDAYQLVKTQMVSRPCINKYRAEEILGSVVSPVAFCVDSAQMPKSLDDHSDTIKQFSASWKNAKELTFSVKLRSPGNVFDYLGNVLLEQYEDPPHIVMIKAPTSMIKRKGVVLPLLQIYKNTSISNPAYSVSYKGATYTISDDDDSYTKPVLEFMSSLITLSKIPGAVPASPAVLVR
jgi:uncharacterized protein YceK